MTAITAPAARTTPIVRTPEAIVRFAGRIVAGARYIDSVFAGAATAPSREIPRSLGLLR